MHHLLPLLLFGGLSGYWDSSTGALKRIAGPGRLPIFAGCVRLLAGPGQEGVAGMRPGSLGLGWSPGGALGDSPQHLNEGAGGGQGQGQIHQGNGSKHWTLVMQSREMYLLSA